MANVLQKEMHAVSSKILKHSYTKIWKEHFCAYTTLPVLSYCEHLMALWLLVPLVLETTLAYSNQARYSEQMSSSCACALHVVGEGTSETCQSKKNLQSSQVHISSFLYVMSFIICPYLSLYIMVSIGPLSWMCLPQFQLISLCDLCSLLFLFPSVASTWL